ncbi:MAG: EF-hand domain-containing protein [Pseudomonadota bacterium]
MPLLPLLILAASSTAQAPAATPAPAAPTFAPRHGGRLFISPMGEPFRADSRADGLADWFRQADHNHDGQLTLDEMQTDADRFFVLLDVNNDGEIDPDEIERYETVVAPEISSAAHFAMAALDGSESGRGHGHRRGGDSGGENDQHQGAGRYGLLDLPEPVTAADKNFNRGVSREEFRQAAAQRFIALDLDHHGYLSLSGLQSIRPAPAAEPNRDTTHPSDDDPHSAEHGDSPIPQ